MRHHDLYSRTWRGIQHSFWLCISPPHAPPPLARDSCFFKRYNIHSLERFFSIRAEIKFLQLDLTNRDRTMVALNIK